VSTKDGTATLKGERLRIRLDGAWGVAGEQSERHENASDRAPAGVKRRSTAATQAGRWRREFTGV